jgi:hypothetical protein
MVLQPTFIVVSILTRQGQYARSRVLVKKAQTPTAFTEILMNSGFIQEY